MFNKCATICWWFWIISTIFLFHEKQEKSPYCCSRDCPRGPEIQFGWRNINVQCLCKKTFKWHPCGVFLIFGGWKSRWFKIEKYSWDKRRYHRWIVCTPLIERVQRKIKTEGHAPGSKKPFDSLHFCKIRFILFKSVFSFSGQKNLISSRFYSGWFFLPL